MALFSSTTAQVILLAGHLPTSMMTPYEARVSSLKVYSLYCREEKFSETQRHEKSRGRLTPSSL